MDATNLPTNAGELKDARVATCQASVDGVKAKIAKLDEHLDAAHRALAAAEADLAAAKVADPEFVEPTEHVVARAR